MSVLGEDPDSRSVARLREEIRTSGRVRSLLSPLGGLGRAGTTRRVYYKWQGLQWVLEHLVDLGYPPGDPALAPIVHRVVSQWLGPAYYREFDARTKDGAYRGRGVPRVNGRYRRCASQQGNALRSAVRLGLEDGAATRLVERLLHWQWPDGGWNCDRDPSADTSSFMETRHPMLGLAAYAAHHASAEAASAADRAAEVFLERRLYRARSDGRVIHSNFLELHFPPYWHYDVLAGLRAMVEVGKVGDPRCGDALDRLESLRLSSGGWAAQRPYGHFTPNRFVANGEWVDWGPHGRNRSNDWVTVDALAVLAAAGRLNRSAAG